MFADVIVEVGRRPGITMVPANALTRWTLADGSTAYHVFLVNGDKAEKREVKIGVRRADLIEIAKGIRPGDMVVTLGSHRLRQGSKVKVIRRVTAADRLKEKKVTPTTETTPQARTTPEGRKPSGAARPSGPRPAKARKTTPPPRRPASGRIPAGRPRPSKSTKPPR